jgi:hypothetical protein
LSRPTDWNTVPNCDDGKLSMFTIRRLTTRNRMNE